MHSDRCGHASGQESHLKGSRKETERQDFMYRDTMNVESKINGHASNNQSHWHSNKRFKENLEANQEKILQIHHKRHVMSHLVQKVLQSES
jgi:hypothetical protein